MMPNHLHLLFLVPDKVLKINKIIANGKRFMAYEIVKRLRKDKKRDILQSLEQGVSFKDKRRNKIHQVFEISSDLKVLLSERFILQKINYIHRNPVSKKWMLINDYRKYKYSSAGFYEGVLDYKGYPVTHYLDV
jgi:REP element-mobilizing transposase RayT